MTRQTWQLIVGLGWCVSMLSACSPTSISSRCGWLHPEQAATQLTNPGQAPIPSVEEESEPNPATRPLPFAQIIPPPPPLPKPQDLPAFPGPLTPESPTSNKPSQPPRPSQNLEMNRVAHQEVSLESKNALVVALNYMVNNQPIKAMESLKAYSPATQEYLRGLLPILETLDSKGNKPLTPDDIWQLQKQLENLMQTLRSRAELVIDKMCFCECIKGYDNYEPLPEGYEFKPTQGNRPGDLVQIYLQLRNFSSKEYQGHFITCLESTVELHQMIGKEKVSVWTKNFLTGRTPLRSPTLRNECFTKHTFCTPDIGPGRYLLTVQVVDQTGPTFRKASKTIDFIVGNGP